jgi:hypothetical protein
MITCDRPLVRRTSRPLAVEFFRPVPQLPTELLDRIVSFVLLTRFPLVRGDFRCIASFSLASLRFRKIALRRYFSDVQLWNGAHWRILVAQGENALLWVRYASSLVRLEEGHMTMEFCGSCSAHRILRVQAETLALAPVRLSSLAHLRSLLIDCSRAGPVTQPPLMRKIFKHVQPYPLLSPDSANARSIHPAPNPGLYRLTSLKLTALPYIDKALLTLISTNLMTLTTLYISCTDRLDLTCCWNCLEDSASSSVGMFPIPDMFSDVFLLAVSRMPISVL